MKSNNRKPCRPRPRAEGAVGGARVVYARTGGGRAAGRAWAIRDDPAVGVAGGAAARAPPQEQNGPRRSWSTAAAAHASGVAHQHGHQQRRNRAALRGLLLPGPRYGAREGRRAVSACACARDASQRHPNNWDYAAGFAAAARPALPAMRCDAARACGRMPPACMDCIRACSRHSRGRLALC